MPLFSQSMFEKRDKNHEKSEKNVKNITFYCDIGHIYSVYEPFAKLGAKKRPPGVSQRTKRT